MIITQKHIKTGLASFALVLSVYFFLYSIIFFTMNDVYSGLDSTEAEYEISKIDFDDPVLEIDWMKNVGISQTDSDPVEVGLSLGIQAYIETNEIPKEAVIHIFHEDMKDFFGGNNENGFLQISSKLDKVLSLKFGDVYHIEFDLDGDDVKGTIDNFTLNGFESHTFQKAGTYFAIVSMKLQDDSIVHYKTSSSVMDVNESGDRWINTSLRNLLSESNNQKASSFLGLAFTVLGIGFSLFFVGMNFWLDTTRNKIAELRLGNRVNVGGLVLLSIIMGMGYFVVLISSGASLYIIIGFLSILGMISVQIAFPKVSSKERENLIERIKQAAENCPDMQWGEILERLENDEETDDDAGYINANLSDC